MARNQSPWPKRVLEVPPGEELSQAGRSPRMGCVWPSVLAVLAVGVVAAALLVPAFSEVRVLSNGTRCRNNLKQLGIYLQTYVSRYGSDEKYPTCCPLPVPSRGPMANGPNGAFWSHLWLVPTLEKAVWRRPGEDGLAKCNVFGGVLTSTALDFSGPKLSDADLFPGHKLSDRTRPDTYIGGDLLGADGGPNHGGKKPGTPDYEFNGLRFDGSVQRIPPSEHPSSECRRYTHCTDAADGGVRTR